MLYDENMDPQCIELCDVLNEMDGIETTESCCGHLKSVYSIFFRCYSFTSLGILARSTDRNYSDGKFEIVCVNCDVDPANCFLLRSKEVFETNEELEESLRGLIENINYWGREEFSDYFSSKTK